MISRHGPTSVPSGEASHKGFLQKIFQMLILSMVILMIGGGVAFLWQNHQGSPHSHANPADVGIVGPPTLAAATINHIFASIGSPMAGTGAAIEQISRQTNVDDAFALGVWYTETNDGMAGVGSADRNPGSVRGSAGYPAAFDGYTIYPSYTAAIYDWFNLIRNRYISRGLTSVYTLAPPYVGTSSAYLWAAKVTNLMYRYRAEGPPPVVNTPAPQPTVDPRVVAANNSIRRNVKHIQTIASNEAREGLASQGIKRDEFIPPGKMPPAATETSTSVPALPQTPLTALVLFGLLSALAIFLYGLQLGQRADSTALPAVLSNALTANTVAVASGQAQSRFTPLPDIAEFDVRTLLPGLPQPEVQLRPASVAAPITGEAVWPVMQPQFALTGSSSARPFNLPARTTENLPHRIRLVSTATAEQKEEERIPALVGAGIRPGGLLSRYREAQQ